jgi:hypothetical protein
MAQVDYNQSLHDFIIAHPFIFTDYQGRENDYFHYFFPVREPYYFRSTLVIDPKKFIPSFRANIVQTYQTTRSDALNTITLLQFDENEHCLLTYGFHNDKLAAVVNLYLKDPQNVPKWEDRLKEFKLDDGNKKFVGFAPI